MDQVRVDPVAAAAVVEFHAETAVTEPERHVLVGYIADVDHALPGEVHVGAAADVALGLQPQPLAQRRQGAHPDHRIPEGGVVLAMH